MLFYTLLAVIIFHAALVPLFIFILTRLSARIASLFLAFVVIESIFIAFYTVLNFGGAFGPGILFLFSSCLLIPLSLLFFVVGRKRFRQTPNRHRLYWIGGLIIVVAQFAPLIGVYGIGGYCDSQAKQAALPLIQGGQPSSTPTFQCLPAGYGPQVEFEIQRCSDGTTLLTTESFDGSRILRYNFSTKKWSGISFLDGACSFLQ